MVDKVLPASRIRTERRREYSDSAAMTIAAEPNPHVALLDMIVLTTPGRRIYEEHYREKYGSLMDEMILERGRWTS